MMKDSWWEVLFSRQGAREVQTIESMPLVSRSDSMEMLERDGKSQKMREGTSKLGRNRRSDNNGECSWGAGPAVESYEEPIKFQFQKCTSRHTLQIRNSNRVVSCSSIDRRTDWISDPVACVGCCLSYVRGCLAPSKVDG